MLLYKYLGMNNNIFNILDKLHLDDDLDDESINKWCTPAKTLPSPHSIYPNDNISYTDIGNYINKKKIKLTREKHKHKNMLCKNIISKNTCHYGSKCLYAHSLEEQKTNDVRKKAFQLVGGEIAAETVNIYADRDLYKTLLSMCDICEKCADGKCTGGYNCREGVYDKIYAVCRSDLNNGTCTNVNCNKKHLTKKGLKPYFKYILDLQKEKHAKDNDTPAGTLLTVDFFKNIKISNPHLSLDDNADTTDMNSEMSDDYNFETSIFEVSL
jgi:hypothetical protein